MRIAVYTNRPTTINEKTLNYDRRPQCMRCGPALGGTRDAEFLIFMPRLYIRGSISKTDLCQIARFGSKKKTAQGGLSYAFKRTSQSPKDNRFKFVNIRVVRPIIDEQKALSSASGHAPRGGGKAKQYRDSIEAGSR